METYQPTKTIIEVNGESLTEFQTNFAGELITADRLEYETERLLWNKLHDKRPGMIAQCTGIHDVIAAVKYAKANNLLVSVRGGGHNVAGNAIFDDGLVIDLSKMRNVYVNPKNQTAIVQGGATWGDVDRETQVFNLACAGGVVSDTGVGGLTLGGGLSWLRRKVGMSIDNLVGADMVLADGNYVHVSDDENPDLFWAIRGGGGNFGIVVNFYFKLHELGPNVMMAACMYAREDAEKIMKFWIDFTRDIPDEISSDCIHWTIPEHPAFPPDLQGKEITALAGMYFGSPHEGEKALQPLRDIAEPVLDLSGIIPFTAVNKLFDPFLQKGTLNSYWKCLYVKDIDESLMKLMIEKANEAPSGQALLSVRYLQGAISKIKADATGFGDRSARFLISIDTMWQDDALNDHCVEWTRNYFKELEKYSTGKVYLNFNSDDSGIKDLTKRSFDNNYQKLAELKAKYDPDNFFRMNANIEPAHKTA